MKIVVFGAAGRTGRLIVERALGHGHEVTAFVHNTALEAVDENLTILKGDVRDADAVRAAVLGHRAVAFALSQGSGAGPDIHEAGIANVIYAMAENMVTRLAAVSAAGAFARKDKNLSRVYRTLISTTLRTAYDDLEAMELRIMASDLDWTIVRPVGLTDNTRAATIVCRWMARFCPRARASRVRTLRRWWSRRWKPIRTGAERS
ncbi:MAG: NAD(P)H-binding protein [Coriobacteriia bacterium]